MAKAALLFNGIKMSFVVIDEAIAWAKQSGGSLVAIFLLSGKAPNEDYIFPSDLDAAVNLSGNTESYAGLFTVIESNRRIVEHHAVSDKVKLRSLLLTDPSAQILEAELDGCEVIFTGDDITKIATMTQLGFNIQKWLLHSPIEIRQVRE